MSSPVEPSNDSSLSCCLSWLHETQDKKPFPWLFSPVEPQNQESNKQYLKPLSFEQVLQQQTPGIVPKRYLALRYLLDEWMDWWMNPPQMFYSIFSSTNPEIHMNESGPISKLNQNWLNNCTGLLGETKTLRNEVNPVSTSKIVSSECVS